MIEKQKKYSASFATDESGKVRRVSLVVIAFNESQAETLMAGKIIDNGFAKHKKTLKVFFNHATRAIRFFRTIDGWSYKFMTG